MREYKVEVVEKHIMYVEAKNAFEAMETAKLEAVHDEPDEINAEIIEEGEEEQTMSNTQNLIERMKATANTTGDALRKALSTVKDLADDIKDTIDLLIAAKRNGLLVEEYLKGDGKMSGGEICVDRSWRLLKYARKHNVNEDRIFYIDDLGDVYYSTYLYKNGQCCDTFMVRVSSPSFEQYNQANLKDILDFLAAFHTFKARLQEDIERQLLAKEVKA